MFALLGNQIIIDSILVFIKPLLCLFSRMWGGISISKYCCIMREHCLNHSVHLDPDNSLIFPGSYSECIAIMGLCLSQVDCLFYYGTTTSPLQLSHSECRFDSSQIVTHLDLENDPKKVHFNYLFCLESEAIQFF